MNKKEEKEIKKIKEEIRNVVITVVAEQINIDKKKIKLNTNLLADLPLDSLDLVEILMNLEDRFNIESDESDINTFETIEDITNYIYSKTNR